MAASMSCTCQSIFYCILCNFCIRTQVRHPHYGPWEHVPPHVWTDKSNSATTQDKAEDEADVCVLCCQKRSTIAVCGECEQHYRAKCIDTHTCGTNVVCWVQYK